jgi:hypothetical protein
MSRFYIQTDPDTLRDMRRLGFHTCDEYGKPQEEPDDEPREQRSKRSKRK